MTMQRWMLAGVVLGPVMLAGCHDAVKTPAVAMAPALPEIHVDGQCGVRQASGEYAVDAVLRSAISRARIPRSMWRTATIRTRRCCRS